MTVHIPSLRGASLAALPSRPLQSAADTAAESPTVTLPTPHPLLPLRGVRVTSCALPFPIPTVAQLLPGGLPSFLPLLPCHGRRPRLRPCRHRLDRRECGLPPKVTVQARARQAKREGGVRDREGVDSVKGLSYISNRQRRKEDTFCASALAGIERFKPTSPAPEEQGMPSFAN